VSLGKEHKAMTDIIVVGAGPAGVQTLSPESYDAMRRAGNGQIYFQLRT
jgi:hypothetical protein